MTIVNMNWASYDEKTSDDEKQWALNPSNECKITFSGFVSCNGIGVENRAIVGVLGCMVSVL